ncbi:interferon-induced protein with tetratricopeptide repeats 5-like [Hemicordylus capensis]|uniref:interferon-induced protein with tetratricopeptide repeats 5-like n=1 Tax=Hemicordylus capensis TaxID=884348 RepID=UPI002304CB83|nr:interferon-induced protein with tetratricopeptide repeats 5-like [Hemicordylus capensis]
MSNKPLKEKLQALQCHFTWPFEIKDKVDAVHILQTLALHVEHTLYRNRSTYLAMRAYLHHLQGCYKEALQSLREAEEALKQDHPANFSRQVLLIYGNYAWVYYHFTNYEMVELYLGRIREICRSLSSPDPYSVLIPEIYAQKGWSLLAVGFRNGEQAKECFQMALKGEEESSNEEFQAGLAISTHASWTHSWAEDLRKEARKLLEEVLFCQPQNHEVRVYLARVLCDTHPQRAESLVEEAVQSSLNPEVLRNASKVYPPQSLPRAIEVLQRAISLDPSFHLLHYDLGIAYWKQVNKASPQEKGDIIVAATESFRRAVETDPLSIFARLKLAILYGEKSSDYEEEIYQNLLDEMPSASKRCQQKIYLHWGDFLLYKKGRKEEALEMYKAGVLIPGDHPLEKKQLKTRLKSLARMFQQDSEADSARCIYRFLETVEDREPGHRERAPWGHSSQAGR